jgi:hypothetical protein
MPVHHTPGKQYLDSMQSDMKWLRNHKNSASMHWLLAIAIMFSACLPVHYHLHHLDVEHAMEHAHELDLHFIVDANHLAHHNTETTIIQASPDRIVNDTFTDLAPMLAILFMVLLLPLYTPLPGVCIRLFQNDPVPSPAGLTPPLRAPPLS